MRSPPTSVAARITGRVQGVGFRDWARAEAETLGLTGWVRNERDGTVAALLAGPADAVEAMLARLRDGPTAARVDTVTSEPAVLEANTGGFRITD